MAAHFLSRGSFPILLVCAFLAALSLLTPNFAASGKTPPPAWPALDPAELASASPKVDPEAGAEVLFRETNIEHRDFDEVVTRYYVRAKIYSERGLEEYAKIEIPYDKVTKISDLAVRTIKPDGQIVELTAQDFYDREVLKAGKDRIRLKSFAPAALQPGTIVEYRYTETTETWLPYAPLFFQGPHPARLVRFTFSPIPPKKQAREFGYSLKVRLRYFNCPDLLTSSEDDDGKYTFEIRDLPSLKDEPDQPPELNCRTSILACYNPPSSYSPYSYWPQRAYSLHDSLLLSTKTSSHITKTLATLVTAQDTDDQKLRKLYDYCRAKITNLDNEGTPLTRSQRDRYKPAKTATDTLKRSIGTSEEINTAFVALARAAGFDSHLALANDRSFVLFDARCTEPFMMPDTVVAVKLAGKWTYFDPGATYLPYATLHWSNTDTSVLIAESHAANPRRVEGEPAELSHRSRKARLHLAEDGTLEGDVTVEYTGQRQTAMQYEFAALTVSEQETAIRDALQEHLPEAEVTAFKIEGAGDPLASLKITYHLRVPEYADRTGSRIFLQPALFQKNAPPAYTDEDRRTNLMFSYRHFDIDEIRIALPDGFELEEGSAPGSLSLGELGHYRSTLGQNSKTGEIIYTRNLTIKAVSVDKKFYPNIRDAFEIIHKRDAHTLTLKRRDSAPNAQPPAASAPTTASPEPSLKATATTAPVPVPSEASPSTATP